MRAERIAVIAVHGVADQSPGSTARAVVDLLVASSPEGTSYEAVTTEAVTLPVEPLRPRMVRSPREGATPKGEDRSPTKAFLQSLRSDFQRRDWKAPDSAAMAWDSRGAVQVDADLDRGIAFTEYLLSKHLSNGARRETYETTRIGIRRTEAGSHTHIDLFEMYWADLSRLSGAIPRIVTELFTMTFRLSKLGRDTVDEARGALRSTRGTCMRDRLFGLCWSLTSGLQIALDWMFVNGLALLFLQLALLAAVLVGLGLLSKLDPLTLLHLHRAASGLVAIAGLLMLAYRYRDRVVRTILPPLGLVASGVLILLVFESLAPWVTVLLLLGAVTLVNEMGLRVADDRFPFVRSMGRWLWAALALLVLESARRQFVAVQGAAGGDMDIWIRAALFGTEVTLFTVKWVWIVVGGLMVVWMVAGWGASIERGYESKASVATGRLGMGLSIGAFLTMTMATWALLSAVLGAAGNDVTYSPCLFSIKGTSTDAAAATAPAIACLWTADVIDSERAATGLVLTSAKEYLELRYRGSTSAFSLVAAVLLCLLAFLVVMFVPSILAEMKVLVERSRDAFKSTVQRNSQSRRSAAQWAAESVAQGTRTRRLGRWLTMGYRNLDGVTHTVFGAGVLLGLAVALGFAGVAIFTTLESPVQQLSQNLLRPLVIGAASIAASLVVFGGLLSKYLPVVRGPLDIALDVDNHFREFPRTGIPRARIFSRYAALLNYVAARKYDLIVIVAHSQGTVISSELLRFLSSDGEHPPAAGAKLKIDGVALAPVRLLTLGCPLRQLYAARFPSLYRWVIVRDGAVSGPRADDLGVERWVNAFCSGDYVGRWLWSDHPVNDQDPVGHPMVDTVDQAFGRVDAYAAFNPMPPSAQPLARARELEVCLGLGAHTHYFERDQTTVAWLIDYLLRAESTTTSTSV